MPESDDRSSRRRWKLRQSWGLGRCRGCLRRRAGTVGAAAMCCWPPIWAAA